MATYRITNAGSAVVHLESGGKSFAVVPGETLYAEASQAITAQTTATGQVYISEIDPEDLPQVRDYDEDDYWL